MFKFMESQRTPPNVKQVISFFMVTDMATSLGFYKTHERPTNAEEKTTYAEWVSEGLGN
jgi:hypothetical protein